VLRYKQNLFNLHIEGLLDRKIKDFKHWGIVNCGLYFHKATTHQINDFVTTESTEKDHEKYLKFISHFDFFGFDGLTPEYFSAILSNRRMNRPSYYFDEELYNSFKRYLSPPSHVLEQGVEIHYSSEQQSIINADPKIQLRVSGVAGCGKTFTIAKRAVMAHKRHHGNVLVVTFNISLRNLIRDKISRIREDYAWNAFHIVNYHGFFRSQVENHEVVLEGLQSWKNINIFENVIHKIQKYQTIIIDEIQDFEEEWIKIIRKYFLAEDGEIMFFGDEKQNIYLRDMEGDTKKPYTGVRYGSWRTMKTSFRMSNDIGRFATLFQKEFFEGKYELDEKILKESQTSIYEVISQPILQYYNISEYSDPIKAISKAYFAFANQHGIHDNDIAILCSKVRYLRQVDFEIRQKNIKTNVMFESVETLQKMCDNRKLDYGIFIKFEAGGGLSKASPEIREKYFQVKEDVEDYRKYRKLHFYPNPGLVKLSTTHSFKGWDSHTLILILDIENNEKEDFTNDEMVYTALTRCKENLIVINLGNEKYDEFFRKPEISRFFNKL
jgi:superfamily I DNA/RNA helicase